MADYADRLLAHDLEISGEVIHTLAAANRSSSPACSDEDIGMLRRSVFVARFIKDVGRVVDNQLLCSSTAGQLEPPVSLGAPDFTSLRGLIVYQNRPLRMLGVAEAQIIAVGRTEAVLSPDIYSEFPQKPLHYYSGVLDRARSILHTPDFGSVAIPPRVLASSSLQHIGDEYYLSRCSRSAIICTVVHTSMQEIRAANRGLMVIYMLTGGVAGIACALSLFVAGHKRRTQTYQLKRAILLGKLSVAYQPIVELGTHRIAGAEALARWTDEDGDSIRPETIIALAEAEGFVSEITRFVLTRALDELQSILESNPEFRVSINLAPSDLADPRLLLLLDEKLAEHRIQPASVVFEITERATSDRQTAIAAIRRLRQRGHAVLIDDFGTGYSNLAYLSELKVNGIKISRSFIATIGTESVTSSIVPQILAVARALDLEVVVQGIERQEQALYFSESEQDILGQGWFFGMPIPARSLMYLCAEKTE
ncbi:MAG TPA: EAL domain-containing protein [Acidobacteriaceae bacterium]|nr:EAL domain-containing protein [Acidobacteriaceae bacterium]